EPGEKVLAGQRLGNAMQIRATARSFPMGYGGGTAPASATQSGAACPRESVTNTYDQRADEVRIALTTTWSGQFRITGTPTWTDVAGTATTTSSADPLQVYEARSRLVADDLS